MSRVTDEPMTVVAGPVVCTGASGFLGSAFVRQAAAHGLGVRGVTRTTAPSVQGVTFCRSDVQDRAALGRAFRGARTIVHAAALVHVFDKRRNDRALFTAVNEEGTANVLHAAVDGGATHVVLVSSVAVYGSGHAADERTPCRPVGPYAVSKWRGEQRAIEIAEAAGVPLTVLRFPIVYGEGDRGNIARLLLALDRGRFVWVGDGRNRKSLIHRDDAARAILLAVTRPASGTTVYNVTAAPCTMRELVSTLAAALGRRPPRLAVPAWVARPLARAALGLTGGRGLVGAVGTAVARLLADDAYDGSRFAAVFGFRAGVDLPEGLRRQVAWYRNGGGEGTLRVDVHR